MNSKQNILDEILHKNCQLSNFDHYFNNTTNKKENIEHEKESGKHFHHRGFHDKKYNWYVNIKRKYYKDETSFWCYKY